MHQNGADKIEDRGVRNRLVRFEAVPGEQRNAARFALGQRLGEQTRFPDARIACDQERPSRTVEHFVDTLP